MNWEAIGAIGEIVGAMAVFVSLVYLALQIRNQNKESRVSSVHEITEAFRQSIESLSRPDIAPLYVRGVKGLDELEEWERLAFIALVQGLARVWEEAYYQHSEGRLDDSIWAAMDAQYTDWVSAKGLQEFWQLRKLYYRSEFREHVDSTNLDEKEYRF